MADIENWLKGTLLGIIILGALGSLLALLILTILRRLATALQHLVSNALPTLAGRVRKWYEKKKENFYYALGYEAGVMGVGSDTQCTIAYFAYHLSRALVWIALSIACAPLAGLVLLEEGQIVLTLGGYLLVVMIFLGCIYAWKHLVAVKFTYARMPEIVRKAREKEKELQDASRQEATEETEVEEADETTGSTSGSS